MLKITTGDLAKEIRQFLPYVDDEVIRRCVDDGSLPAYPRIGNKGWHYLVPDKIIDFLLKSVNLPSEHASEVAKRLGINFKQMRLFNVA